MTTDCTKVPTLDDIYQSLDAMDDIKTFTYSTDVSFIDSEGKLRKTLSGILADGNAAITGMGWDNQGEFSTLPPMTDVNDVAVFDGNFWVTTESLPYTATGSSPLLPPEAGKWVVAVTAELLGIARSFNVLNDTVKYTTYTGILDGIKYLFNAAEEVIWAVPNLNGTGEVIFSVVGSTLTTSGGSYYLIPTPSVKVVDVATSVAVAIKQKWLDVGISVRDFATDGVLNSDAINRTVNYVKSGAVPTNSEFANKICFPAGDYDIDKPVWIYQMDGIEFRAAGKFTTRFNISPTFAVGTMPPEFTAINGVYRDYTYDTTKAVFIVAARRVTGGADGVINPTGANTAAWHLKFSGMSFHGDVTNKYDVSAFYAPEIAHSAFDEIYCQYVNTGFLISDIYQTTISNYKIDNSTEPLIHFSSTGHNSSGTTLNLSNCGATRVTRGWRVSGLLYSAWNNVACDIWGYDQTESSGKFAYDFNDSIVSMSGCGAESGAEGALLLNCGLLRATGTSRITHTNCQYFGTFDVADVNVSKFQDTSSNRFENCDLNMGANGGNGTAFLTESARVSHSLLFGKQIASEVFNVQSDSCSVVADDPNQQQVVTLTADNYAVPVGTVPISLPHTIQTNPQLMSTGDGSGVNCKMTGVFNFEWSFVVTGNNWQYILVAKDGVTYKLINFENVANKRYAETISLEIPLVLGEQLTWLIRGTNGDATGVLEYSNIKMNRIR